MSDRPVRYTIRRERPDQPEVVALLDSLDAYLASLYPPDANYIMDVQALMDSSVAFYVLRDGERAVGTGAYRSMPGEPASAGQPYAEVKRMYVDPAHRGQRLGERVIAAMEADMRQLGLRLALLETGGEQLQAVKLYERCGYTAHAPFGGYADNGLSVFMGKRL